MLKSKAFWLGFLLGYFLVALVPSANVLSMLGKKSGG